MTTVEVLAVLDTNVFGVGAGLGSPLWVSLRRLCAERGVVLCIPQLVLDETVNLRREGFHDARNEFIEANNRISKFYDLPAVYVPDPDEVATEWANDVSASFRVLPAVAEDALEALRREASRTPPARGGKGARDCLIWLTCRRHAESGAVVHFVSRNTRDFAERGGQSLHGALAEEVDGIAGQLIYHSSLDRLFDALAVRVEGPDLSDPDTLTPFVAFELWDYATSCFSEEEGAGGEFETSILRIPELRTLRAYQVEGRGLALVDGNCSVVAQSGGRERSVQMKFMAWVQFDLETKAPTAAEVETAARAST